MNIEPINNTVIVRQDEASTVSPGGVYIIPGAVVGVSTGTIVAVSEYGTTYPSVKVGARIAYGPYCSFLSIPVDGESLLILKESEILLVFKD